MNKKKIKVLHLVPDDKFFDGVIRHWENDEDFTNKSIFISKRKNYSFRFIRSIEKIENLWNKRMIKERFNEKDYDVLFIHSFRAVYWNYMKYIPKDRIVIWWIWGHDIYNHTRGLAPLIKVNLYKPETKKYKDSTNHSIAQIIRNMIWRILRVLLIKERNYAINRVDYCQPVVKEEYTILQQLPFFKAKEFYYKDSNILFENTPTKNPCGNILLGNSSTLTNNHVDALNYVLKYKQKNQKVIMPLSYGDMKYKKWLKERLNDSSIEVLEDFIPKDEYFKLVDSCSYEVIGTIRQQAMGNIQYALSKGVKVFLYKDSIAYINYKKLGYVVFAIEEMTLESLSTPLSKKEIEQNIQASQKEVARRESIHQRCVNEIREILASKKFDH